MDGLTMTFTVCAALGGALFVVRLILQFTGIFGDSSGDVSAGHHDITHSDFSFKVLSFQGITAFLLMFGLAGRALMIDSHTKPGLAVLGASVAGILSVWVIAKLFALARGLQSSGTSNAGDAVGAKGTVYLNIPPGGTGQVQVNVRNRQEIHDARTEDGAEIPTGTPIQVISQVAGALLVRRI